MKQHRLMNDRPHDRRAHTREARTIREQRRQRRFYASDGTTARSCYAFWLGEFITDRQPGQPYPLGRQYARRFLAHIRHFHQASLAGH
ncbi:hypothetical protein FNT36_25125 [Hymenobacter setariae]|uniref:Uncharacterized protein n=1 Tax=Hymenobacter setariae TaxID=2594794 RepID=A0A558BJW7_9BACT|nr:hypothetical protein [Hymenobacter setariae]TVT36798.1 hypothetical protein FNT36_25125 [Hymenobacter setariae]